MSCKYHVPFRLESNVFVTPKQVEVSRCTKGPWHRWWIDWLDDWFDNVYSSIWLIGWPLGWWNHRLLNNGNHQIRWFVDLFGWRRREQGFNGHARGYAGLNTLATHAHTHHAPRSTFFKRNARHIKKQNRCTSYRAPPVCMNTSSSSSVYIYLKASAAVRSQTFLETHHCKLLLYQVCRRWLIICRWHNQPLNHNSNNNTDIPARVLVARTWCRCRLHY